MATNLTTPASDTAAHETIARDLERATSKILNGSDLESYIDATGKRCYRARGAGAAQRHANHTAKRIETLRHYRAVEQEARGRLVETLPASRDSGPDETYERYVDPDAQHDDGSDA